ncbi:MAG: TIGR00303 family protein [Methanomicrobiales archaeon]|jgi:uncharacterized protein (TIGR00303 family)|nr:TIGR00303 family protein [Methanomicrobiales archaeon]
MPDFITPEYHNHALSVKNPLFCGVLANTLLSTVPGLSGAGPSPKDSLLVPVLDAELIINGEITSTSATPNTATGCPTPAAITRAMMELINHEPLFVNAGLYHKPTVSCYDLYGEIGQDPRGGQALQDPKHLFERGKSLGKKLTQCHDLIVIGECVPGGTTTALLVLRALGYQAHVSSAYPKNPTDLKETIAKEVLSHMNQERCHDPWYVMSCCADPMMPVVCGIVAGCDRKRSHLILAGGTQMLAVAALTKMFGDPIPDIVTTIYVKEDSSANITEIAEQIKTSIWYVNPKFGEIGHKGLARYCIGEVKEGMGAGGAMMLAYLLGKTPDEIKQAILTKALAYSRE